MQGGYSAIDINLCETVARIAGYQAMKRLKEQFGGSRLYIPTAAALTFEHPLVRALGIVAATKVCGELHRTRHYIPRPREDSKERLILWADRAGLKRADTSRLAQCSDAYVYRIIAQARAAGVLQASRAGS